MARNKRKAAKETANQTAKAKSKCKRASSSAVNLTVERSLVPTVRGSELVRIPAANSATVPSATDGTATMPSSTVSQMQIDEAFFRGDSLENSGITTGGENDITIIREVETSLSTGSSTTRRNPSSSGMMPTITSAFLRVIRNSRSSTAHANYLNAGPSIPIINIPNDIQLDNPSGNTADIRPTPTQPFSPPPPQNQTDITSADLNKLINEADGRSGTQPSIILVDCRSPGSFSKKRIQFYKRFINIPFSIDGNIEGFSSKAAVINFILEHCPDLLEKLNAPGYYSDMILLDEASTTNMPSVTLKYLCMALTKWNEGSTTKVKVLHGGLWAFSNLFPSMVLSTPNTSCARIPLGAASIFDGLQISPNVSAEVKLLLQGLSTHVINLDTSVDKTKELLKLNASLKCLVCVKAALVEEQEQLVKELEARGKIFIPKEAPIHAKQCSVVTQEICRIEERIRLIQDKMHGVNVTLDQSNQKMANAEQQWNSGLGNLERNIIPDECKKVLEEIREKKTVLSTLNVSVMSSLFFNDEPKPQQTIAQDKPIDYS